METKYYVDAGGRYLGGFAGAQPEGGIEVATAPNHARDIWSGMAWVPFQPAFVDLKAVEVAYWKDEREKMNSRMNSIQDQLAAIGDTVGAASCRALRQSLLGLFTDPAVVAATTMPVLKAAFKARYKVATDLATTSAKLEFLKYES